MPRLDRTGPQGNGPMTGRGMGRCGNLRSGLGRCFGFGRGLGRYFGFNAPQTKEEKIKDVEEYRKALQEELEDAEKELKDLR